MYVKLGVSAVFLVGLLIAALQNKTAFDLRFILWNFRMPFSALVGYSATAGAAVVAFLALPKLLSNHMRIKRLDREVCKLREACIPKEGEHQRETTVSHFAAEEKKVPGIV